MNAIGHNSQIPPIKEMLAEGYAKLLDEVSQACAAFHRAPATIESDEISGKVADLVSDLRKLRKQANDAHDTEKAPYLQAGHDVDEFFRVPAAECKAAIDALLSRQAAYLHAKELAARQAAAKAEQEARERADAELRAAERAQDQGDFDTAEKLLTDAAIAEEVAETAAATVAAKPADLTRTYSKHGAVTSLRKEWTHTVEDRARLDLDALRPYFTAADIDKAIRGFIKAGGRTLKGAKIFEQPKAR